MFLAVEVVSGVLTDSLALIGKDRLKDPWGHPFVYVPLPKDVKTRWEMARKIREVRAVNTDYDLYYPGKDGRTDMSMSKKRCWDDVARAYNGSYTGLVRDIL